MVTLPSAKRFLCPHVQFSEMLRLSSCASRAHDGDKQLTLTVESPDVLLFKIALYAMFLEFSDGRQTVHGISGKAADALGNDEVDLPGQSVRDHFLETLAVLGAGIGDAFVGVHAHELPVVPALDVIGVIIDLRLIACELIVVVSRDAGVPCHLTLFLLRNRRRKLKLTVCLLIWSA